MDKDTKLIKSTKNSNDLLKCFPFCTLYGLRARLYKKTPFYLSTDGTIVVCEEKDLANFTSTLWVKPLNLFFYTFIQVKFKCYNYFGFANPFI